MGIEVVSRAAERFLLFALVSLCDVHKQSALRNWSVLFVRFHEQIFRI